MLNIPAPLGTIPWIATIFAFLPRAKAAEGLFSFARERVKERLPLGQTVKDIFSYLLVEDRPSKKKYTEPELVLESLMLSIAGEYRIKGVVILPIFRQ